METRKGKVTKLYQEHGGWRFEIEVLTPAWTIKQAEIVLPNEETDIDLVFSGQDDPQYEDRVSLISPCVKEKPPFVIDDAVSVRFT